MGNRIGPVTIVVAADGSIAIQEFDKVESRADRFEKKLTSSATKIEASRTQTKSLTDLRTFYDQWESLDQAAANKRQKRYIDNIKRQAEAARAAIQPTSLLDTLNRETTIRSNAKGMDTGKLTKIMESMKTQYESYYNAYEEAYTAGNVATAHKLKKATDQFTEKYLIFESELNSSARKLADAKAASGKFAEDFFRILRAKGDLSSSYKTMSTEDLTKLRDKVDSSKYKATLEKMGAPDDETRTKADKAIAGFERKLSLIERELSSASRIGDDAIKTSSKLRLAMDLTAKAMAEADDDAIKKVDAIHAGAKEAAAKKARELTEALKAKGALRSSYKEMETPELKALWFNLSKRATKMESDATFATTFGDTAAAAKLTKGAEGFRRKALLVAEELASAERKLGDAAKALSERGEMLSESKAGFLDYMAGRGRDRRREEAHGSYETSLKSVPLSTLGTRYERLEEARASLDVTSPSYATKLATIDRLMRAIAKEAGSADRAMSLWMKGLEKLNLAELKELERTLMRTKSMLLEDPTSMKKLGAEIRDRGGRAMDPVIMREIAKEGLSPAMKSFDASLDSKSMVHLQKLKKHFSELNAEGGKFEKQLMLIDKHIKKLDPEGVGRRKDEGRLGRFAMMQAAYGAEDFAISSQMGGMKMGVRAVTNNLTAMAGALIPNGKIAAGVMLGITAAAIAAGPALDRWEKSLEAAGESAAQAVKHFKLLNSTLGDMRNLSAGAASVRYDDISSSMNATIWKRFTGMERLQDMSDKAGAARAKWRAGGASVEGMGNALNDWRRNAANMRGGSRNIFGVVDSNPIDIMGSLIAAIPETIKNRNNNLADKSKADELNEEAKELQLQHQAMEKMLRYQEALIPVQNRITSMQAALELNEARRSGTMTTIVQDRGYALRGWELDMLFQAKSNELHQRVNSLKQRGLLLSKEELKLTKEQQEQLVKMREEELLRPVGQRAQQELALAMQAARQEQERNVARMEHDLKGTIDPNYSESRRYDQMRADINSTEGLDSGRKAHMLTLIDEAEARGLKSMEESFRDPVDPKGKILREYNENRDKILANKGISDVKRQDLLDLNEKDRLRKLFGTTQTKPLLSAQELGSQEDAKMRAAFFAGGGNAAAQAQKLNKQLTTRLDELIKAVKTGKSVKVKTIK